MVPQIQSAPQLLPVLDTDVLITHGPPFGVLDKTNILGPHLGCEELAKAVSRIKPRLHVFGHIHGGYGREAVKGGTAFVNAAVLNERYVLAHAPIVIELSTEAQTPRRTTAPKLPAQSTP